MMRFPFVVIARFSARVANKVVPLVLLALTALLLACNGSDDDVNASSRAQLAEMIAVLPENTRGVLQLDVAALQSGDASTVIDGWLNGETVAEPFARALEIISYHLADADINEDIQRLVLAQTRENREGFILLLQAGASTFDLPSLTQFDTYKGQPLFASEQAGLLLAQLNDGLYVVASEEGIQSVIDVFSGDAASLSQGSLQTFLAQIDEGAVGFAYGLPALYGDVKAPGSDEASLLGAQAVSGVLELAAETFSGQVSIHSDNAQAYVDRFTELSLLTEPGRLTVGEDVAGEGASVDVAIPATAYEASPAQGLLELSLFKKMIHGMNAVDYTDAVVHGGNKPWMNFNVGGNPNSIFINFEFKDASQIAAFEANVLPAGFTLAPLRILTDDAPSYFLVLNIYRSSGGLVSGVRAEWSVFVNDPVDGHPRFLVVQAAASDISADSVNLLTFPEPVSHDLIDGKIVSYVGVKDADTGIESNYFTSRIVWPQIVENRVNFTREFVAANDYIYWGNGVADRGFYNASVHNREAIAIANAQIEIIDDSPWADYVKPDPKHSYVYINPLDIVVSPWWNLDADYLDVSSAYRQQLINFKNNFYPMTVQAAAAAAMVGGADALAEFTVGQTVPSIYYHFQITDTSAFEAQLNLDHAQLAKIKLLEAIAADYFLTLRVYLDDDAPEGARAEWLTYVADGDGPAYSIALDVFAADAMADPVNWLQLPVLLEHKLEDNQVKTQLQYLGLAFEANTYLGAGLSSLQSLDWVEAGDRVCRLNGVCDKFFYDGQTMEEPVFVTTPAAVDIRAMVTPWDGMIARQPTAVFIRENAQPYAWNPWANVP